jgi:hydroxyethylthiazole kinase
VTEELPTLPAALGAVAETAPLVNAVTNAVTVNDVAQIILHWGGLPVMSDDEREVDEMVTGAEACLLNMGTVSEAGEATMVTAGQTANEAGVPVVLDPVGVGATSTRDRVARRLAAELDVAILKGNYAEVTALAGEAAEVRGVESVGEYDDIAATAAACARAYDTVVVASGATDVVATADRAYEVAAGDPAMGEVVGTGCMLGATAATFAGGLEDPLVAALVSTTAFGLAGEAAADGAFGPVHGPASYQTAFRDAVAGLSDVDTDPLGERITGVAVASNGDRA